jgi:hypothetical protein
MIINKENHKHHKTKIPKSKQNPTRENPNL